MVNRFCKSLFFMVIFLCICSMTPYLSKFQECKRCALGDTLTRTQASVGISQPCERPLVTSHQPSCSLFLLSLSYSLTHLLYCHSFQLLVFSLAFLFLWNPLEHLSIGVEQHPNRSQTLVFLSLFCCQSESCNTEESIIGEKIPPMASKLSERINVMCC